jgi:hypothetical protein
VLAADLKAQGILYTCAVTSSPRPWQLADAEMADGRLLLVGPSRAAQFSDQHRYALALHTDERHPHVHLVVKAMSEDGVHLNIRKPLLREWRREFARHLRAQGVAAKATPRAVRERARPSKLTGIYRPRRRVGL